MKIKPLGERVLVEPIKEDEVAKGGIIIPDSAKEKPQEGKIIAIQAAKTIGCKITTITISKEQFIFTKQNR